MGRFGLIGEKLGHSFSPMIHSMLKDYEYGLYEIEMGKLGEFMQTTDIDGFNVTIPYKQDIMEFCTEISDSARSIGSVNTVVRRSDGTVFGDNTDYYGFEYLLRKSGVDIKGKKAIVLGNGGASKTVQAVLRESGASEVVVISRRGENNYENISLHYDAEVIVNSTPVGMYPNTGVSVVEMANFTKCGLVLDLIYNPHKTEILLQAEKLGIPAFNGLTMLTAQAKKASEIFTDSVIDDSVIDTITDKISSDTANIALIGMPGCGKSTVGKRLAEITGRELVDIDTEIENITGMKIPDIFAGGFTPDMYEKIGMPAPSDEDKALPNERVFRKIETYVLSLYAKRSGIIISCGGGVVTVPENKDLLNQNSVTVLINRPIEDLETSGRPLSQSKGVRALYEERKPLYESWCDFRTSANNPEAKAREIIEYMKL